MPVSLPRPVLHFRNRDRCHIRPESHDRLDKLGLRTARDFLALSGVVVSGHVGRNVSRVDLGGTAAYLKREHRVRVRDRFRSWRDGFGWASVSGREAWVLRRLGEHNLPCPKWLAWGEANGQAFLLLEAAERAVELRSLAPVADDLAERLGRLFARMHASGIDQPDLYAKHVLVRPDDLAVTILDWQRAVVRCPVRWASRLRSLAAFRATAPPEVLPDTCWERLLAAYRAEAARPGPTVSHLRARVEQRACALLRRPGIRSQRAGPCTAVVQELVRLDGERACVIPEFATNFRDNSALVTLYDRANDGRLISFSGGRSGFLRVAQYRLPFGRWWAAVRGQSWRSPELRAARLLFHLERHGIPGPKLLAYGQTVPAFAPARSFVLCDSPAASPIGPEDATAVRTLLDRLHAARCRLLDVGPAGEPFGMVGGQAVIRETSLLRLAKRMSPRRIDNDRARLDAFFWGQR